ncbi:MAG: zinc dependent phospholipase C family protein [Oscillospiraceae bacterium]
MPAAITHHIHGESVLNYLKQEKNLQNVNETAYYWGCQGPDFLFAHRFFSWMKGTKISQFGGELHHADPNKTLRAMIQYVSTRQESVYASYLLGFFCHYSLDSTAHPYINFLAKELLADEPVQTESIMHCEIESALDTIVLRTEKGQLPSDLNLGLVPQKRIGTNRNCRSVSVCGVGSFGRKYRHQAFASSYRRCSSSLLSNE